MPPQKTNVIVIDARDKGDNYKSDPTIPFDRFYLVKEELVPNLSRLVPFALVVPLGDGYEACLKKFKLDWKELRDEGYQVAVPVNMTRLRTAKRVSTSEVRPTYIANKRWWRRPARIGEFIPEDVTLSTPTGPITPMCVSCEYSLQHLSGECQLGTRDCLDHLRIQHEAMDEKSFDKDEDTELAERFTSKTEVRGE